MALAWLKKRLTRAQLAPATLTPGQRDHWLERGFLILPGFFEQERISALQQEIKALWDAGNDSLNPLVIDVLEGKLSGRRLRMREAPSEAQSVSHKLNDLYLFSERCRAINLDTRLVSLLRELLSDEPVVINSLNFEKGSRQPFHFDTYYMPPPVAGGMAVSSVCMEDVHPDAGPLHYYPGSHRIPPYVFPHGGINQADADLEPATEYIRRAVEERGLEPETFCGQAGDVFLWHAQLYHGGSQINDPQRTRRSLVTHYWSRTGMDGHIARTADGGHYLDRAHPAVPVA